MTDTPEEHQADPDTADETAPDLEESGGNGDAPDGQPEPPAPSD